MLVYQSTYHLTRCQLVADANGTIREKRDKSALPRSGHAHQCDDNVLLLEVAHLGNSSVRHDGQLSKLRENLADSEVDLFQPLKWLWAAVDNQ